MEHYVEVKGVSKAYGKKTALKEVSISLNKGIITGLIGENGAGKTTLMRCILGLAPVTKGDVFVAGYSVTRDTKRAMKSVGFLLEPCYYSYLSAYDNLKVILLMHHKWGKNGKQQIGDILELVGLHNEKNRKVGTFSFGMRQRFGLAQAMICNPEFLILDEPLVGLDPLGIELFSKCLENLCKEKGITILFSSHTLDAVEKQCEEVIKLKSGEVEFFEKTSCLMQQIHEFVFGIPINSENMIRFSLAGISELSPDGRTLLIHKKSDDIFEIVSNWAKDNVILSYKIINKGLNNLFNSSEVK